MWPFGEPLGQFVNPLGPFLDPLGPFESTGHLLRQDDCECNDDNGVAVDNIKDCLDTK